MEGGSSDLGGLSEFGIGKTAYSRYYLDRNFRTVAVTSGVRFSALFAKLLAAGWQS